MMSFVLRGALTTAAVMLLAGEVSLKSCVAAVCLVASHFMCDIEGGRCRS